MEFKLGDRRGHQACARSAYVLRNNDPDALVMSTQEYDDQNEKSDVKD